MKHAHGQAELVTLYRDEHLQAIAKPPGMSSVSERWHPELPTVMKVLWAEWKAQNPDALRPHLIHRLDKDTTGVLIFACHRDAQVAIRQQFRARTVEKTYLAITRDGPAPPQGTIEIEIAPDPHQEGKMKVVGSGGKACTTGYEVIEEFRGFALLRLTPRTGRTHQIRVSLAHIGTPCAVDPLYGGEAALYLSAWKRDYKVGRRGERPVIARLTLHAESLTIAHPATGAPLRIEAPLPKDLTVTLKHMRRYLAVPGSR